MPLNEIFGRVVAISCMAGFAFLVIWVVRMGLRQARERRERLKAAIDGLRARDPGFDPARLAEAVQRMARILLEARTKRDASKAEPFLSDGLREALHCNINADVAAGIRVEFRNLEIRKAAIEEVEQDGPLDLLRVDVTARWKRVDVEEASGRVLRDGLEDNQWEAWTLMRRRDAASKADFSLADGRCPACGASTAIGLAVSCPSCGRPFRSGKHDWVVVRIRAFVPARERPMPAHPPGARAMRMADPQFSVHRVMDKGAAFFFRYLESERTGDAAILRALTPPGWIDRAAEFFKKERNKNLLRHDIVVIEVALVAVVPNLGDGSSGAWVSVRWFGSETDLRGGRRLNHATIKLRRAAGILTREEATLVALACGRCGAPYGLGDADTCRSCGRVLNDAGADWIIEPPEQVRSLVDAFASLGREGVPIDVANRFDQHYAPGARP